MTYLQQHRHPLHRMPGLGAVIALHVGLIYALLNGLGVSLVEKAPAPTIAHLVPIQPPVLEPPPPPTPTLQTPQTVYVPVPDVKVIQPPTTQPVLATLAPAPPAPPALPSQARVAPDHEFSDAHRLGGAGAPDYPDLYQEQARAGQVRVSCVIETDGTPTNCRILGQSGGAAFATATLRWLTGPNHPIYQPVVRDGQKRRETHQWQVNFQPPP